MIIWPLRNDISFHGRSYRVNLAFDNILRLFEAHKDKNFDDEYKIRLSLELLIGKKAKKLSLEDQISLYKLIYSEFIEIKSKASKQGPPVFSFTQDEPLIYAAFIQAYNVDLTKERGRMDWRYFMALLQALPSDTLLREVMSIRGKKVPARTKYNQEEIKNLMEAKAYWAIDIPDEEAQAMFQKGVERLADTLIKRATKK